MENTEKKQFAIFNYGSVHSFGQIMSETPKEFRIWVCMDQKMLDFKLSQCESEKDKQDVYKRVYERIHKGDVFFQTDNLDELNSVYSELTEKSEAYKQAQRTYIDAKRKLSNEYKLKHPMK